MNKITRYNNIIKSFYKNYYNNLGNVQIIHDNINLDIIKFMVIPFEGIHKDIKYIITLKWNEENKWPLIYIDSDIYDKIKTNQYLKNIVIINGKIIFLI